MDGVDIKNSKLKFDILLEQTGENDYVARTLALPGCIAKAATSQGALKQIRVKILERLARAKIVTIEIDPDEIENPLLKFSGDWADDPGIADFREEIERYRQRIDDEWEAQEIQKVQAEVELVEALH